MTTSPIQDAFEFVNAAVLAPALAHPELSPSIKARVSNSERWLSRFTRVGDLLEYLQRFRSAGGGETFDALKALGLTTFEDIVDTFESRYQIWSRDRSTPQSFVVGQSYSTFEILIFVGSYDTRAGGMFLLGTPKYPQAVVIKATMSGGRYPNEWLEPHRRLKYFLKSIGENFGEHYQENAAILNTPGLPVMAFVRPTGEGPFTYEGTFKFERLHRESDGSKWFELSTSMGDQAFRIVVDQRRETVLLAEEVERADLLSDDELTRRLATEPRKAARVIVQTTAYVRSALVVAAVLRRANGVCEACHQAAPFERRSDGTPYLEVHHRIRLADDGDDTVQNALALCPNCHRKAHYG